MISTLRHFDLEFVRIGHIAGGDAESGGGHLLDGRSSVELWILVEVSERTDHLKGRQSFQFCWIFIFCALDQYNMYLNMYWLYKCP